MCDWAHLLTNLCHYWFFGLRNTHGSITDLRQSRSSKYPALLGYVRRNRKAYQPGPIALYMCGAQFSQKAALLNELPSRCHPRSSNTVIDGLGDVPHGNVGGVGSPLTLPGLFLNCRLQLDRILERSFQSLRSRDAAMCSKTVVGG